jgi:CubicO group peptidase (beta-lactamase class C family)
MTSRHPGLWTRCALTLAAVVGGAAASHGQPCPEALQGVWRGQVPIQPLFELGFTVHERSPGHFDAEVRSATGSETVPVWREGDHLRFQPAGTPIAFDGIVASDGSRIDAFVHDRASVTRIVLIRSSTSDVPAWEGRWSVIDAGDPSLRLDLYVEDDGEGAVGGYWFFRDQRMPGLWGYGLSCRGDEVSLGERSLGVWFAGAFDPTRDTLDLTVTGPSGSVPVTFGRVPAEEIPALPDAPDGSPGPTADARNLADAPDTLTDGWPTAPPAEVGIDVERIGPLVAAITAADTQWGLPHAILIARHGKLVVEEYFYGYDHSTWQDMRSASKTVASTLVGLAIRDGHIPGADTPVLSLLPRYRRYDHWDPRKAQITVADLMNMNSGLDANDYDPESAAAEPVYQSQTARQDWVKLALDVPLVRAPGAPPFYYGGANPLIVGGVLDQTVGEPVQWFADRTLFAPLGITDYKILLDPGGVPYMGGGLRLRPRDMLAFGQMYLNGGMWNGHRVLPEQWVRESWTPRGRLQQFQGEHAYGYLWWHFPYRVGDRVIDAIEARGNGGQYISVFPSLDLVVVITGGNYRNGKVRVPEEMLAQFILPAVVSVERRTGGR